MRAAPPRVCPAWVIVAHAIGGAALGTLESWKLDSSRLSMVMIPLFALTGLVVGLVCAATEWLAMRPVWTTRKAHAASAVAEGDRVPRGTFVRGAVPALIVAAPSLIVTVPVFGTLMDGAYAQTLPLAGAVPYAAPIAVWLVLAAAIAIGKRLAAGDLVSRVFPILTCAGIVGGTVWSKKKLGSGYLDAQLGATLAVIVAGGVLVRLARRVRIKAIVAAIVTTIVLGVGIATLVEGLAVENDRRRVTISAGQGRDLVRMWRGVVDRDGDGSSPLLGGGDCDDSDASVYPGAVDTPGDGIDQDCDGEDAVAVVRKPLKREDAVAFRWSLEPSVLIERTKGMNVLLITVDALRFDLLAPDAVDRDEFPRIAKLLDEGVYFTRAIAPATSTDVSLCALLTGRDDPFQPIDTTLGEALKKSGRTTLDVMPSEVLRHVGEVMLGRGFTMKTVKTDGVKRDVGDHVTATATADEIVRGMDAAKDKPWLLWAHFFDIHEHHQIHVPGELWETARANPSEVARGYRALLIGIDRQVGRLLDELDKRDLAQSTIVVFASDHGESFKEDPRLLDTHGLVAYGPLARIPIAFRIPGVAAGRRTDPISMVDVAPTLLALIDRPGAMGKLDGFDLVPAILDGPPELRPHADRAIAIHEERQWSVVEWPYQLIVEPKNNIVELYDLLADPAERTDLATKRPDITRRLRSRYAEAPRVRVDRTPAGRAWREQQARPPQHQ